jgi:hypothetical protein
MFWTGKFIGVVVFGLAISLCFTVCSMPEMFAQKQPAGHCHTEQQEEEEQNDSQKHCCNRESILPSSYTCIFSETDQDVLPVKFVFTGLNSPFENKPVASDRFLETSSPPPIATILRI